MERKQGDKGVGVNSHFLQGREVRAGVTGRGWDMCQARTLDVNQEPDGNIQEEVDKHP